MLSVIIGATMFAVTGCTKNDLTIAKNGHLDLNKTIAIGKALDEYKYFEKKEWQALKAPNGTRVVILKTDMNPQFIKEANEACIKQNPQGKKIESQKWSIQFTINEDNTVHISGTQTLSIYSDKTKKVGSLNEELMKSVFKNELAIVCK